MRTWLAIFALCVAASAQPWSGIITPARAVNWSATSPGVIGGVPSATWTQCGSTIAAGASAATINSAIQACAANHYVLLGSGTFSLAAGLVMKANIVLRGSGADQTIITFASGSGVACGGYAGALAPHICFADSVGNGYDGFSVQPGQSYSATWSGGYSQGATSITVGTVGAAGIVNGQYLYLDQVNDTAPAGSGEIVCDTISSNCRVAEEAGSPGRCSSGPGGSSCTGTHRNQIQIVKVVSGCASACTGTGPFTITVTPGLYGTNWASGKTPGAWWSASDMQNAGIENLTVNYVADSSTNFAMMFLNAENCWVSGVRSEQSVVSHVFITQSAHITVQNSYFFGTQNASTQSYGVESYISSDNLVVNNIFQHITAPIVMGPAMGSAFVYNFSINDFITGTNFMSPAITLHDPAVTYTLYEGNLMNGYRSDVFHGAVGGVNTLFRNYFVGWEWNPGQSAPKVTNTVTIQDWSYSRFDNYIGNVLGCNSTSASVYPGNCGTNFSATYQTANQGAGATATIYDFGAGLNEGSNTIAADSYIATSVMKWGNYDVKTGATRWCGNSSDTGWSTTCSSTSEVPTGLSDGYANTVPGAETLPASFLYSTKPSWWSSKPWPSIGPDVSGGNIPGVANHAYTNPAADCYLTTMTGPPDGSGSVLTFNASNCYSPSTTSTPCFFNTGASTVTDSYVGNTATHDNQYPGSRYGTEVATYTGYGNGYWFLQGPMKYVPSPCITDMMTFMVGVNAGATDSYVNHYICSGGSFSGQGDTVAGTPATAGGLCTGGSDVQYANVYDFGLYCVSPNSLPGGCTYGQLYVNLGPIPASTFFSVGAGNAATFFWQQGPTVLPKGLYAVAMGTNCDAGSVPGAPGTTGSGGSLCGQIMGEGGNYGGGGGTNPATFKGGVQFLDYKWIQSVDNSVIRNHIRCLIFDWNHDNTQTFPTTLGQWNGGGCTYIQGAVTPGSNQVGGGVTALNPHAANIAVGYSQLPAGTPAVIGASAILPNTLLSKGSVIQ